MTIMPRYPDSQGAEH